MARGVADLEWLLDYELRNCIRYRRFVSILMVVRGDDPGSARKVLAENLIRGSDERFEIDGCYTLLMGETDRGGALAAADRLKQLYCEQFDLRFAIVSFPVDGYIARDLLATVQRRIDKAKTMYPGAVVATG